jgi:hypothetical protein
MNEIGNRGESGPRGLLGSVGLECREFRRGAPGTAAHAGHCVSCRDHLAAVRVFAGWLAERPSAPAELGSPGLLEAIYDRVVVSVEASATGAMLAERMPVPPIEDRDDSASTVADDGLARAIFVRPAAPSASDWRSVREAILRDGAIATSAAGSYRRRIGVGFLGVAAAAMVCGLLLSDGTSSDPTIVITDVLSAPDVEFVVLRRGILR